MEIMSKEFQDIVAEKLKVVDVHKAIYDNLPVQHYYYQMYVESQMELIRVKAILDSVYAELLHYYKFEYDFQLTNQKELETYITNNEKYRKVNRIYQLKKLESEMLEEVVTLFKNRSYTINNILKFMELEKK